jgi:hypothetical protein
MSTWSYTKEDFIKIQNNFNKLIVKFRSLIKNYNKDNKKDFYHQLNLLKKEINSAELLNPKKERNLNFFKDESNLGDFSYNLMKILMNFPKINDELLDSPQFVNEIQSIFEKIIKAFAFDIYNIGDFAELIAKVLNKMTREKYFIVLCDHLKGDQEFNIYNCGRAFMQNKNQNFPETRFIIFNTNMDAQPDRFILEKYGEKIESDYSYSNITLNNENDSIENRDKFIEELLQYKSEVNIDKKMVLENFFNKIFDKMFYLNPKKIGFEVDFNLIIPILDFNYDIIFDIVIKKEDQSAHYKFYTVLDPTESPFAPKILTQVFYLPSGEEKRKFVNQGLQIVLRNLEKLI